MERSKQIEKNLKEDGLQAAKDIKLLLLGKRVMLLWKRAKSARSSSVIGENMSDVDKVHWCVLSRQPYWCAGCEGPVP